jgi:NADH-quinone oxidoreductase subunit J
MNVWLLMLQQGTQNAQSTAASAPPPEALYGSSALGMTYFVLCAILALGGAIAAVASPNPIRGAMGLLLMIVSIAGLFLALHAQFLAAIQLIVYAGAVVVLFLFVIMLLGASAKTPSDSRGQIPRYGAAALFAGLSIVSIKLVATSMVGKMALPGQAPADFGSIDSVGKALFTETVIPFEISSALLIVAVVGALAVARGKQMDVAQTKNKSEPA